jgi:hypothetical protein
MAQPRRYLSGLVFVALLGACSPSANPTIPTTGPPSAGPSQVASATPAVTASPLPTAAPTPTASAEASETEEPAAGSWAQDPPKPLLFGRAVRVVVDVLNIRERASTSARLLGSVKRNAVLVVILFPPVDADGYIWYHGAGPVSTNGEVPPLPNDPYDAGGRLGGWFAAMKGSTPYVEALGPRCPADVNLKLLDAMLPAERLACFGHDVVTFEGTFRGAPGVPPEIFGEYRPGWLADPNIVNFVAEVGTGWEGGGLNVRFPASIKEPAAGSIIRVRGHFDDPAAANCTVALALPWGDIRPVPTAAARLWCRQMFVVGGYDVIGSDPDMPVL